jgi:hypothetical protein
MLLRKWLALADNAQIFVTRNEGTLSKLKEEIKRALKSSKLEKTVTQKLCQTIPGSHRLNKLAEDFLPPACRQLTSHTPPSSKHWGPDDAKSSSTFCSLSSNN